MRTRSLRAFSALALALLGFPLPAEPAALEAPEPARGELRSSLDAKAFEALVLLGSRDADAAALAFSATADGALLRAGLRLGAPAGEGAFLAAGPGRAAGPLRLLADPLSFAAVPSRGGPLDLDPSLESGTAVLGAGSGGLSAFVLASGFEPGFIIRRESPAAEAGSGESPGPRSLATGFLLEREEGPGGEGGRWSAISALAARRGSEGGGGWEPEPPPEAAGLVLLGAILRERRGAAGRTLFGLAASLGRLEGPGLAARLESEAREGPFFLRLAAACAGRGFRELSASRPERFLSAAADLRLALRRAVAIALALRLESPRSEAGESPLLGSSGRLGLSLPLGGAGKTLEPRLEVARKPGGRQEAELGLALGGMRGGSGSKLDLALGLGGEEGIRGLRASLASGIADEALGLGLGLELGLSCLEGGDPSAPLVAEAALGLSLRLPGPGREGAELRAEASGPEGGFLLAPIPAGEAVPRFELSFRYVRRF